MMVISLCEEGFERNEDRFYEMDQGGLSFSLSVKYNLSRF